MLSGIEAGENAVPDLWTTPICLSQQNLTPKYMGLLAAKFRSKFFGPSPLASGASHVSSFKGSHQEMSSCRAATTEAKLKEEMWSIASIGTTSLSGFIHVSLLHACSLQHMPAVLFLYWRQGFESPKNSGKSMVRACQAQVFVCAPAVQGLGAGYLALQLWIWLLNWF